MTRRLRDVLARQWSAFALLLAGGFAAMAVLLAFLLEDAFIDGRLREAGAAVAAGAPATGAFERVARAAAPAEWRVHVDGLRAGRVREFRLADGRYLHVLAGVDRAGDEFLLAYDVSDQLHVNAALARGWPWLLAMAAALAAAAWWLARRFVDGVEAQSGRLLHAFAAADAPARLDALAAAEPVAEFAELARLAADAWRQRLDALARERETLAFLAHELRTPLQSARTSLALLADERGDAAAWRRLQRAHDRLRRASDAVLWLRDDGAGSREHANARGAACDAAALLAALADEFAPLAAARAQAIRVEVPAGTRWDLPAEVVETVLANLLLNALQHGGAGTLAIVADRTGVVVANPPGDGESAGFGVGLQVVARLLAKAGASLRREDDGDVVRFRVRWDDGFFVPRA